MSTMKTQINCWEHADALAMAVRLRKSNKCPGDIDNLYGEIVRSMVNMATLLLLRCPKFTRHASEFMSEDVQSSMLLHALTALERDVDTQSPRKLVNYTVKVVQNRLRNYVRDTSKRSSKLEMLTESQLGCDIFDVGPVGCNLEGEKILTEKSSKVDTCDRNFN